MLQAKLMLVSHMQAASEEIVAIDLGSTDDDDSEGDVDTDEDLDDGVAVQAKKQRTGAKASA